MLQGMRKNAKYFYFLFALIIVSFVFWGVGRVDKGEKRVTIARVGQETIYPDEYWTIYQRQEEMQRELYPDKFDEKMREELREKVLNEMIDQRVLLQAAVNAGIKVSDQEVEDSIIKDPTFIRKGVFDKNIYLRTLQASRLTPKMYENLQRNSLLMGKMARLISESVDSTPADLAGIKVDDQTRSILAQVRTNMKKEQAIRAYIEGMKKNLNIEVRKDLIS
jgi:hypothetical protein